MPLNVLQVSIYPLRIYLTETMYRKLWDYLFPGDEQDVKRQVIALFLLNYSFSLWEFFNYFICSCHNFAPVLKSLLIKAHGCGQDKRLCISLGAP